MLWSSARCNCLGVADLLGKQRWLDTSVLLVAGLHLAQLDMQLTYSAAYYSIQVQKLRLTGTCAPA